MAEASKARFNWRRRALGKALLVREALSAWEESLAVCKAVVEDCFASTSVLTQSESEGTGLAGPASTVDDHPAFAQLDGLADTNARARLEQGALVPEHRRGWVQGVFRQTEGRENVRSPKSLSLTWRSAHLEVTQEDLQPLTPVLAEAAQSLEQLSFGVEERRVPEASEVPECKQLREARPGQAAGFMEGLGSFSCPTADRGERTARQTGLLTFQRVSQYLQILPKL
jgi:hypothetical protein